MTSGQVVALRVTRTDHGSLIAAWRASDECGTVTVSWGRSPASIDHGRALTMDARDGSVELGDDVEGRTYVSVGPAAGGSSLIAGERRVPFSGPANFRDLGGYRTRSGRHTRWGRIFRSDALRLRESDFVEFGRLGIRVVWDLRSEAERLTRPNRVPEPAPRDEVVSLFVQAADGGLDLDSADDPEAFLVQVYLGILERSAGLLGRIFTGLAREHDLPAVVHCAGGKDRTGIVSALLLTLLGVARQDVLDDYEMTSLFRSEERATKMIRVLEVEHQFSPAVSAGLIGTPRWAMAHALEVLDTRYGGVESYLRGPAGLPDGVVHALRTNLVE